GALRSGCCFRHLAVSPPLPLLHYSRIVEPRAGARERCTAPPSGKAGSVARQLCKLFHTCLLRRPWALWKTPLHRRLPTSLSNPPDAPAMASRPHLPRSARSSRVGRTPGVLAIAFALWWAAPNAGGQDRESGSAATIGVETDSAAGGAIRCLPNGDGYVRARISGALNEELRWENEGTECSGAVRPTDGGVRMRFSRRDAHGGRLVLLFGVA